MHGDDDLEGGDAACWLDRVCDECGQVVESGEHRCEAARPASTDAGEPSG